MTPCLDTYLTPQPRRSCRATEPSSQSKRAAKKEDEGTSLCDFSSSGLTLDCSRDPSQLSLVERRRQVSPRTSRGVRSEHPRDDFSRSRAARRSRAPAEVDKTETDAFPPLAQPATGLSAETSSREALRVPLSASVHICSSCPSMSSNDSSFLISGCDTAKSSASAPVTPLPIDGFRRQSEINLDREQTMKKTPLRYVRGSPPSDFPSRLRPEHVLQSRRLTARALRPGKSTAQTTIHE